MNLGILKFIGLGVIGIGGAGTAIIFGSDKVSKFVGLSSKSPPTSIPIPLVPSVPEVSLSEADKQYQLMYELSKKIFEAVNKSSDVSAHGKVNVIKWLKDQFSVSLENEEDKWENFKSLCEAQKPKENKSGSDMNNEHARLCFVDTGDSPKGYLWKWYMNVNVKISPSNQIDFLDFNKKNVDLWIEFKSKYPNSNPIDKFDEWYNQSTTGNISTGDITSGTGIGLFKAVVNKILSKSKISKS